MNFWGVLALLLLAAYLLGAIPTGYWVGRLVKGIDIRQYGSKSTGATNVLRILGKGPALVVLLVDIFKGVAAIALTRWVYTVIPVTGPLSLAIWIPWAATLAGLVAVVAHSKSIWIGLKGGKSAATALGVMMALHWPVGLLTAVIFVVMLAIARIVSLGSISGAIAAPLLMLSLQQPLPYLLYALAGGTYVLITHRANIQRLLNGTEPKIGQKHRSE